MEPSATSSMKPGCVPIAAIWANSRRCRLFEVLHPIMGWDMEDSSSKSMMNARGSWSPLLVNLAFRVWDPFGLDRHPN